MAEAKKLIQVYLTVDQHNTIQKAARLSKSTVAGKMRELIIRWANSEFGHVAPVTSNSRENLIGNLLQVVEFIKHSSTEIESPTLLPDDIAERVGRARCEPVGNIDKREEE